MTTGSWFGVIVVALLGGGLLQFGQNWWKDHRAKRVRTDEAPARIASMSIEGAGEAVEILRNALREASHQLEAQRKQIALQQTQISDQAEQIRTLRESVRELGDEVERLTHPA